MRGLRRWRRRLQQNGKEMTPFSCKYDVAACKDGLTVRVCGTMLAAGAFVGSKRRDREEKRKSTRPLTEETRKEGRRTADRKIYQPLCDFTA